jgi:hypothetical protein
MIEGSKVIIRNSVDLYFESIVEDGDFKFKIENVIKDYDEYRTKKFLKLIYGESIIEIIKSALSFK